MKLIELRAPDFDLAMTLESGQVFHWQRSGAGFLGTIGDTAAFVEQRGDSIYIGGVSAKIAARYFALDHSLGQICGAFPDDEAMNSARDFCRGLRIIRQPKWECLAAFITSSMKQVAHIRQMSRALRERFGDAKKIGDTQLHTFPSAAVVAQLHEAALRECGLGYRAKNLLGTARRIASGEVDLETCAQLNDAELRQRLCELPGVGPKVANCVMLFAYERLRAFPIDVWIERVLMERYFPRRRKVTARKLREFCDRYFGEQGGYAQQYLFHHARMTTKRARKIAVK